MHQILAKYYEDFAIKVAELKESVILSLVPEGTDPINWCILMKDRIAFCTYQGDNSKEYLQIDGVEIGMFETKYEDNRFKGGGLQLTYTFIPLLATWKSRTEGTV